MRIALCSSYVPFIQGGARQIVDWLSVKLIEHGHEVETIYLPHTDDPTVIFDQMAAFRWVDLTESADRIVCFRPPAHVIPHPNKVLWFIHHLRRFYDLWDSEYFAAEENLQLTGLRSALMAADTIALNEAKHVFTNSRTVSDRLRTYNDVDSEVLYPPILDPGAYGYLEQNDEVVMVCRLEAHKRQQLLVEAMAYTTTPVQLRLCGTGNPQYVELLADTIACTGVGEKVTLDSRWITDEEKADLLSRCLASAYLPHDEDSYGYPSLESSHSHKPILTTSDAGGVGELVIDGENGFVCEPEPQALAEAMDRLWADRKMAKTMGDRAAERLDELRIDWDHVVERIMA